jgi:hypothetical protein
MFTWGELVLEYVKSREGLKSKLNLLFGGSMNWNPKADINSDTIVDVYDVILSAGNYGKTS